MTKLRDSKAILDTERLLTQHQAIITIIQGLLGNPALTEYKWLDLACGKGQIISQLDINISDYPLTACTCYDTWRECPPMEDYNFVYLP
jgi:hypothetical protein